MLVGRSFGGLIAPRGASGEHRLAAMIVDPGQLEMGSAVINRLGDLGRHLDDPAADARFEALLTIPALRTFLAPRMATHGLTSVRGYFRDLTAALDRIRTIFIAMGSTGTEGVLQQIAISAAAGISSIQQVTRLSVLNASADSLLITRGRSWPVRTTTRPAPSARSPAAPAPGGRVLPPVPRGIHLIPARHPQPPRPRSPN